MRKLGNLCVLIGSIIIAISIIGNIYLQYKQKLMYEAYLKHLEVEVDIPDKKQEKDTEPSIEKKAETEDKQHIVDYDKYKNVEEKTVLGKIKIDSIGVDLLLVEGDSADALKLGAGHTQGTAFPGQTGNCVIAGHRNYTFGSMFNRLDEVQKGDIIVIEFEGNEYTYTVTETVIVEPDDLSVLEQNEEKTEVTLITCHPIYSSAHRLIIKANNT